MRLRSRRCGLSSQRILPHGHPSSTGGFWVLLQRCAECACAAVVVAWVLRLETVVNDLSFSLLVNTSGIVRGNLWQTTSQIWLVQIGRLPHGLVLSKGRCLVQSLWNYATAIVLRIDIVKRQFIVLLDPRAKLCHLVPHTWCWQRYPLLLCPACLALT